MSRFVTIKPGIRFDKEAKPGLNSKPFRVQKKHNGKIYRGSFPCIDEAEKYLASIVLGVEYQNSIPQDSESNDISLKSLWERYRDEYLAVENISPATIVTYERCFNFWKDFHLTPINKISALDITNVITDLKKKSKKGLLKKRISVINETKFLSTLYTWWGNHDLNDGRLINNPVKPKHKDPKFATLRVKRGNEIKEKQMSESEVAKFINMFPTGSTYWTFACIHFFMGGRVSEPAAIAVEDIDLKRRTINISRHVIYTRKKGIDNRFGWTKTNESRTADIPEFLIDPLRSLIATAKPVTLGNVTRNLLFHRNNKVLHYNTISGAYKRAMKKAGFEGRFKATHVMRYTLAGIACELAGEKASMTQTGHKSEKVAQVYHQNRGQEKLRIETSKTIEAFMTPIIQEECVQRCTD